MGKNKENVYGNAPLGNGNVGGDLYQILYNTLMA